MNQIPGKKFASRVMATRPLRQMAMCVLAAWGASAAFAANCVSGYYMTPGTGYTCTVPAGVTSMTVQVTGGGGGGGDACGGINSSNGGGDFGTGGAMIQGSIAVTPGNTLSIAVGGGGSAGAGGVGAGPGGTAGGAGGAGGGGSGIFDGNTALVIAGGGGGCGNVGGAAGLPGSNGAGGSNGGGSATNGAPAVLNAGIAGFGGGGGNGVGGGGGGYGGGGGGSSVTPSHGGAGGSYVPAGLTLQGRAGAGIGAPGGVGGSGTAGLVHLSFVTPPPPASVPTLSEWGLLLMSALMVFFGVAPLRRRFGG